MNVADVASNLTADTNCGTQILNDMGGDGERAGTAAGKLRGRNDNLMNVANRLRTAMYVSDRALPPEDVTVASIEVRAYCESVAS